ncbi:itg-like peptide isoform x2 [Dermatophagoides farinae]|uniref:Itg-like peptide isoform x2 n=1 Tax=Dermatophagoides farinae TaxID=6954 RepID=A0A9D4SG75_DERFA|nr:itg-like peptide isoform x2 [Dermatophagoides farinae]
MQLEDILSQGEEKCIQKPCVQQQQCCPGSVCVDLHSQHSQSPLSLSSSMNNKQRPVTTGTCLPIYGVNEGDSCTDDGDCETGLRYAECTTSSECDASHGLCCQLIKRHRMSPRKACLFFSEPKICLGPVDITFAKPANTFYYNNKPNDERNYFRASIG